PRRYRRRAARRCRVRSADARAFACRGGAWRPGCDATHPSVAFTVPRASAVRMGAAAGAGSVARARRVAPREQREDARAGPRRLEHGARAPWHPTDGTLGRADLGRACARCDAAFSRGPAYGLARV